MEERAIHISSVNREKRGTSRPGDFTIKFNPRGGGGLPNETDGDARRLA